MSWEKYSNIGIVIPKLYPNYLESEENFEKAILEIAQDPFFTAMEVSYIPESHRRKKVKNICKLAGVELLFNGGDAFRKLKIDISSISEKVREESVEKVKLLVDQSYEMEAKILHVVTGTDCEEHRNIMMENLYKSLVEICEYAKNKATTYTLMISLETGDRYFDRKYLLGPTKETAALAKKLRAKYDNFGILLDQSHLPLMEENPQDSLSLAKDYLTHIHLGNCYKKNREKPYFGDKHLPFGVEESEIDQKALTSFIKTLFDTDFFNTQKVTTKPVMTFEVGAFQDESSKIVIANIKRMFFAAWAELGKE